MKTLNSKLIIVLASSLLFFLPSCRKPNELPPVHDSYASKIIMPEPQDLSVQDRIYLDKQRKEYLDAIAK